MSRIFGPKNLCPKKLIPNQFGYKNLLFWKIFLVHVFSHTPGRPQTPCINPQLVYSWYGWCIKVGWRLAGWGNQSVIIVPFRGSILQAETCQIFSLAENPRWSRVWQLELNQTWPNFSWLNLTWHDNWLGSNTFGPKHFESSYFCDFRLHTKIKLPRLCRSWKKRWAAGGWVGCGAYVLGGWVVSWQ